MLTIISAVTAAPRPFLEEWKEDYIAQLKIELKRVGSPVGISVQKRSGLAMPKLVWTKIAPRGMKIPRLEVYVTRAVQESAPDYVARTLLASDVASRYSEETEVTAWKSADAKQFVIDNSTFLSPVTPESVGGINLRGFDLLKEVSRSRGAALKMLEVRLNGALAHDVIVDRATRLVANRPNTDFVPKYDKFCELMAGARVNTLSEIGADFERHLEVNSHLPMSVVWGSWCGGVPAGVDLRSQYRIMNATENDLIVCDSTGGDGAYVDGQMSLLAFTSFRCAMLLVVFHTIIAERLEWKSKLCITEIVTEIVGEANMFKLIRTKHRHDGINVGDTYEAVQISREEIAAACTPKTGCVFKAYQAYNLRQRQKGVGRKSNKGKSNSD